MKDTPQFDDPLVRSLVPLVEALSTVNGTLSHAYSRIKYKPSSLRGLMEDIHVYDDIYSFSRRWSSDRVRLSTLIDNFVALREEFERASQATKALAIALDKKQGEQSFTAMHSTVYRGFLQFCGRVERLRPEHLLLQDHFTELVVLGQVKHFDTRKNELYQFEAVARLRDEFFTTNKPGLLKAYIDEVALLKQTKDYMTVRGVKEIGWKPFTFHAANEARLMTQLEVMSLLEEIS